MIEVAAFMLAAGGVIGSISSVFILLPLVPEMSAVRSISVGMGSGLLGAAALVVAYRLVESRLIDMYLKSECGDSSGGEAA